MIWGEKWQRRGEGSQVGILRSFGLNYKGYGTTERKGWMLQMLGKKKKNLLMEMFTTEDDTFDVGV